MERDTIKNAVSLPDKEQCCAVGGKRARNLWACYQKSRAHRAERGGKFRRLQAGTNRSSSSS